MEYMIHNSKRTRSHNRQNLVPGLQLSSIHKNNRLHNFNCELLKRHLLLNFCKVRTLLNHFSINASNTPIRRTQQTFIKLHPNLLFNSFNLVITRNIAHQIISML
ncbi:hypothetical protein Droror1_Dr00010187 [Drosera rotundifolia]